MRDFDFKENDSDGMDTLRAISGAKKFNKWMYDSIKDNCFGNILEIGSGIGNLTEIFLKEKKDIHGSDIRIEYINDLKSRFGNYENLKSVLMLDIAHPDFDNNYRPYFNSFDTIFALNVIEHIKDDKTAIKNCLKLLKENGNLIILVPAYECLYNSIDKSLYHFRRYSKSSLRFIFPNIKQIKHLYSFNFMGIFAWWISGEVFRDEVVKPNKMNIYNSLVPIFRIIDKIFFNKIGLSLIAVYKK